MKVLLRLLLLPLACVAQPRPAIYPRQALTGLITYTRVVPATKVRQDTLYHRALLWLDANGYVTDSVHEAAGHIFARQVQQMELTAGQLPLRGDFSYTITLYCRDGDYRYEFTNFEYISLDGRTPTNGFWLLITPAESLLPRPKKGIKAAPYAASFKRMFDLLMPARISALQAGMRQR
jgi:hypothetical protein